MTCRVCGRTQYQVALAARAQRLPGVVARIRWRATIGNRRDLMDYWCQLWAARIMGVAL